MFKIELYKDENGNVRCKYNGKDMDITELNVPLLAQLYKQVGQLPSFVYPLDDVELNVIAKSLTESIKNTANSLY